MELDRRDRLSFEQTPAVMMPRYGQLAELPVGRVRYLVGAGGMYIEARSRALHACMPIAHCRGPLPFGEVSTFFRPAGGPLPASLRGEFLRIARAAFPAEAAALVLWRGGAYELVRPREQEAGVGRVRYSTAGIDPLDVLIDIHSHGPLRAYFSAQDDTDDLACPTPCFNAIVLGEVETSTPKSMGRLVINGWASEELGKPARHLLSSPKEARNAT